MPILLSFLSSEHSWATQTSAGDFLKAIITISANASQNEQSCIGPNELTRQLVSQACVEKLINDMLKGGNPLTVGVGIVIEVIRKNNSDYDPDVGAESNSTPSSRDPIYLGTLLRMFAKHVPDFMELILSPNHTIGGGDGPVTIKRKELSAAFGSNIEPLGFDRFKTCELMAELLHCSNMGLLNEIGSEDFVRARDLERERLKAEGKLGVSGGDRPGAASEDLTMKSPTTSRLGSGSPDEMRKLEVQNASDDDGFEEVTHAGDLGDDAKDDFDEKPDMDDDMLASTKQNTSLSFLDKDDEEFVDEPLSSPRLKTDADSFNPDPIEDSGLTVLPLSPTKELSQRIDGLNFEEHVTIPSPTQTEAPEAEVAAELPVTTTSEQFRAIVEDEVENKSQGEQYDSTQPDPAPIIPPTSASDTHHAGLSPHPEDKPAPLFASKADDSSKPAGDHPSLADEGSSSTPPSSGTVDAAMGEADNDSNSILVEISEGHSKMSVSNETQTSPVVGDYLKMQFVEHKVVPTILVCVFIHLCGFN